MSLHIYMSKSQHRGASSLFSVQSLRCQFVSEERMMPASNYHELHQEVHVVMQTFTQIMLTMIDKYRQIAFPQK